MASLSDIVAEKSSRAQKAVKDAEALMDALHADIQMLEGTPVEERDPRQEGQIVQLRRRLAKTMDTHGRALADLETMPDARGASWDEGFESGDPSDNKRLSSILQPKGLKGFGGGDPYAPGGKPEAATEAITDVGKGVSKIGSGIAEGVSDWWEGTGEQPDKSKVEQNPYLRTMLKLPAYAAGAAKGAAQLLPETLKLPALPAQIAEMGREGKPPKHSDPSGLLRYAKGVDETFKPMTEAVEGVVKPLQERADVGPAMRLATEIGGEAAAGFGGVSLARKMLTPKGARPYKIPKQEIEQGLPEETGPPKQLEHKPVIHQEGPVLEMQTPEQIAESASKINSPFKQGRTTKPYSQDRIMKMMQRQGSVHDTPVEPRAPEMPTMPEPAPPQSMGASSVFTALPWRKMQRKPLKQDIPEQQPLPMESQVLKPEPQEPRTIAGPTLGSIFAQRQAKVLPMKQGTVAATAPAQAEAMRKATMDAALDPSQDMAFSKMLTDLDFEEGALDDIDEFGLSMIDEPPEELIENVPKTAKPAPIAQEKLAPGSEVNVEEVAKAEGYNVVGVADDDLTGDPKILIEGQQGDVVSVSRSDIVDALAPKYPSVTLHSFPSGLGDAAVDLYQSVAKYSSKGAKMLADMSAGYHGGGFKNFLKYNGFSASVLRPSQLFKGQAEDPRSVFGHSKLTMADRDTRQRIASEEADVEYTMDPTTKVRTLTGYGKFQHAKPEDLGWLPQVIEKGNVEQRVFTDKELRKFGLDDEQVEMYHGRKEVMDNMYKLYASTMAKRNADKLEDLPAEDGDLPPEFLEAMKAEKLGIGYRYGYAPRTWQGNFEIHYTDAEGNSRKMLRAPDPGMKDSQGGSSFKTWASAKWHMMQNMDSARGTDFQIVERKKKSLAEAHRTEMKGEEGYDKDWQRVDQEYVSNMITFAARTDFEIGYKDIMQELVDKNAPPAVLRQAEKFANRVLGKRNAIDMTIDSVIRATPVLRAITNPYRSTSNQASSALRNISLHQNLGMLNTGYGLINLTAIGVHVDPGISDLLKKFGDKTTKTEAFVGQAIKDTHKAMLEIQMGKTLSKDAQLFQELVHEGIIDMHMMTEPTAQMKKMGKLAKGSLAIGGFTEEVSRGVAALAAYKVAAKKGMDHDKAKLVSREFVDQYVGDYSKGGRPPLYTGAVGSYTGQFQTYSQIMAETFWNLGVKGDNATRLRYAAATIGLGGVMGMPGSDVVDGLWTSAFGYSPTAELKAKLYKDAPAARMLLQGVGSYLPEYLGHPEYNFDLSQRTGLVGYPILQALRNQEINVAGASRLFMPVINSLYHLDPAIAFRGVMPSTVGLKYLSRLNEAGEYVDMQGRPLYKPTTGESVLEIIGIAPMQRSELYFDGLVSANAEAWEQWQLETQYDNIVDMIEAEGAYPGDQQQLLQAGPRVMQKMQTDQDWRDRGALEELFNSPQVAIGRPGLKSRLKRDYFEDRSGRTKRLQSRQMRAQSPIRYDERNSP